MIHPDLRPSGGGSLVAVCIIEALKRKHTVSVLTWSRVDVNAINRIFGTALKESEFTVRLPPIFLRIIVKLHSYLWPLRYGILLRLCKRMSHDFDLIISVNNEADFGCRGIQYIHDPPYWINNVYGRPRPSAKLLFPTHMWALFKGKYRPWMLVAGFSYDRMKNNVTLVNSDWTRTKIKEIYGIEATTVYPPVVGSFPNVSWRDRENGFVCIGRISPWKELQKVVQIITEVRTRVPDAHLHIIGTTWERGYSNYLQNLVQDCPWIIISENTSRNELVRLISMHRYGIHGMVDEPFGLAVAEMIQGGCIVFVPRRGGPAEIVGGDDRLLYGTVEEAVRRIVRVMMNHDEQVSVLRFLASRKDQFSRELFMHHIQQIVGEFPKSKGSGRSFQSN